MSQLAAQSCNACGGVLSEVFREMILRKYHVKYLHCSTCGLLSTEPPFWLDEAYSEPISALDTGVVARNIEIADRLAPLIFYSFGSKAACLDVAGGYGLLTRMMRDNGFDFYWDDKYCNNLMARGFEGAKSAKKFRVVTAFEVLEHLAHPADWLTTIFREYDPDALICTTEIYEGTLPPADWWYFAREGGQHITFFQSRTLQKLATRFSLEYQTVDGFHVFSKRPLRRMQCYKSLIRSHKVRALRFMRRHLVSKTMPDHIAIKAGGTQPTGVPDVL